MYLKFFSPSVFAYGKSIVLAAASVGASASQRYPQDTLTLVRVSLWFILLS